MSSAGTLIVGIGSPHGDDQAGWLVAEQLAANLNDHELQVRRAASPAALLDWLDDTCRLHICDACKGLGRLGQVRRWAWPDGALMHGVWSGTHDLSLPAVLQLADQLGRLPKQVVVWSVEAAGGSPLGAFSDEVAAALPDLVNRIANEVVGTIRHPSARSSR